MKIKEIIVVEGRDDTNRVKEAVDCDTFETNGSASIPIFPLLSTAFLLDI